MSPSKPEIRPESQVDPALIRPLDPSLFAPSEREAAFLRTTISEDETEVKRRVMEVQEEAYARYPYPCIRIFHHVSLMMSANPVYPMVLEGGKKGDTYFLDLGCCMGTDVRKLAQDGYPASHVLGCDLRPEFIELGYKLYADRDSCPVRFFASNIFDVPVSFSPTSSNETSISATPTELAQLTGSLTHIYTGALFHLFDESTQFAIALRLATLLKRESGAVIFGRHSGLEEAGKIDDHLGRNRYGHSEQSWPLLWKSVFAEAEGPEFAESRLRVEAKLGPEFPKHLFGVSRSGRMLVWSVQIL
ncbi:hypothetical protein WOLCODRAFT_140696 [Wolfiporia cocos MD-104 SS10]|uniref:Uncharacterized protein n=1 Tax=Wolfiporia cocos (strain MD-104) TaxID=742152 RepID=A0A2H3J5V0_WOLCO|nr:hypothetical protein WOLCODRAFT_140696 [Wolfiporia cocos MD-104 SS10]